MKVRSSIKKICKECSITKRGKKLTVSCMKLRHKQRQG